MTSPVQSALPTKLDSPRKATAPPADEDMGPLDLSCVVDPATGVMLISVVPPPGPVTSPDDRIPVDVCCVIDVSGSMGTTATVKDAKGNTETDGLTLLDVVKHATRTVAGLLGPNDRLSLVTFTDNASVAMPFTSMDDAGKKKLDAVCQDVRPQSMTNLWDGLVTGMDLLRLRPAEDNCRNAAVLLLTDGQPNVEPPRGHIPSLVRYLDQFQGSTPFTVSTFGFGYSLDSKLLNEISIKTGGMYVFIPDSGLVGTVFVNTIANVLCTAATTVTLSVDCPRPIEEVDPSFTVSSTGAFASVGTVQFGQARNFTCKLGAAETKQAAEPPMVKLTYSFRGQKFSKLTTARICEDHRESQEVVAHSARRLFASAVTRLCDAGDITTVADVKKVHDAITQLDRDADKIPLVAALLKDLDGEVTMGLTQRDNFQKWGSHFLPSIVRATLNQQCNNFKDHSVQLYGGELFKHLQTSGEKVFTKIAPPKPTVTVARPASSTATGSRVAAASTRAAAAAPPVNMNRYYNCRGGCVLGRCLVSLGDGRRIAASAVRKGDVLSNGAVVKCVVAIRVSPNTPMVQLPGGLTITPFHPIRVAGQWVFPIDASYGTTTSTNDPFVYTYVLERGSMVDPVVVVDGVDVVTLGHGLRDNNVVQHDYLGTQQVVDDLATLDGFDEGRVVVGGFRRNAATMRIDGLQRASLAHSQVSGAAVSV